MESMRRFGAIAGADLLERVRSWRFWAVQAMLCIASWWSFPARQDDYLVLAVNGHLRAQYSSAWIGMVVAMLAVWLSLAGFYLVRGTLVRDFDSRVWQLLAATPMTRAGYLLAKWCGNLAVLMLVVLSALAVGVAAQWVRAEDRGLDLVELLKPALLLALPSMGLTALIALVFDLVPWLRRTAGNVLFFVLWVGSLAATVPLMQDAAAGARTMGIGDPRGMVVFQQALTAQAGPQLREPLQPGFCMVCAGVRQRPGTFAWPHWEVEAAVLAQRLLWLALVLCGVLLCAPWLDRAAAARPGIRRTAPNGGGYELRWLGALLEPLQSSRLGTLVAAELQLVLRQRPGWWWLAVLAVAGAGALAPMPAAAFAVIGGWALLLDRYSQAPLHERSTRTGPLVFSAVGGGRQVLYARWVVLLVFGLLINLPALLRFGLSQPPVAAAILLVAASLPAWSLALGVLTGNARTFELLACLFGYLAFNRIAVLHVGVDPWWTCVMHAALLPLALGLASFGWPRLARR